MENKRSKRRWTKVSSDKESIHVASQMNMILSLMTWRQHAITLIFQKQSIYSDFGYAFTRSWYSFFLSLLTCCCAIVVPTWHTLFNALHAGLYVVPMPHWLNSSMPISTDSAPRNQYSRTCHLSLNATNDLLLLALLVQANQHLQRY